MFGAMFCLCDHDSLINLQGLRFVRNIHGKPFLDPSSGIEHKQVHHNMTHTSGLVGEASEGCSKYPFILLFDMACLPAMQDVP